MKRLAIFVSGGGTDFQSIIDGVNSKTIDAEIVLCVASKQGIHAIERAKRHNIRYEVFDKSAYASVVEMFDDIAALLDCVGIDLI
ncbi:MAG: phosphoribosylglycinamide formyltransferase, partial [Clostridia bacterium]|nr:phosphoribosylglycinamide formyltransferase [Clostridia bacterium]